MNQFTHIKMILLFLLLIIQIFASNVRCDETHTKMFIEKLEKSTKAFKEIQTCNNTLNYSVLHLRHKNIPTNDFISLFEPCAIAIL